MEEPAAAAPSAHAQPPAQPPPAARYRTEDVASDAGSFADLLLPPPLVAALAAAGFSRPSPVQKAAIPLGRVGTDLIVQAKSGTGKTAAFAAILLDRVSLDVATPQAVVCAPTRELAIQSFQVIERVAAALPQPAPAAAVFVGGLPTADDTKRLRRTCHIAVGSPGRLCGLVTSGALLLGTVKAVVLDEADQLLSEAFYADTAWLLQQLPKRKQVLAFSATFTPELLGDLEPLMRRPQKVMLCEESVSLLGIRQFYKLVGPESGSSKEAVNGAQQQQPQPPPAAAAAAQPAVNGQAVNSTTGNTPDGSKAAGGEAAAEPQLSVAEQQQLLQLKVEVLLQLLSSVSFHQAVVFCNRKPSAEWLSRRLTAAGCPAAYLSSDLPQPERIAAMEAVRGFKVRVIVSTDVMARGVDFDRVNLVVNVDLPADAATYVHRVGRTGRFGSRGIAVALLSARELGRLQGYLAAVKGGEVSPLPDAIPADLYSFDLASDWERQAYQQLLAAPTGPPPDSPPPVRKKCGQQQQEQEGQHATSAAAAAAAAADLLGAGAFSYDAGALELLDFGDDDGDGGAAVAAAAGGDGGQQQQQQWGPEQQQQQEAAGEYDPAAAWDAWAAYYRAQGYDYPYENPYSTQQQPHEEQQQEQQGQSPPAGVAAAGSAAVIFQRAGSSGSGDEAAFSDAGAEEEDDDEDGVLPADEEVDDRARLLLSRLQVAEQAALQQQLEQPPQQPQHPAGQPLCLHCWAGAYEAWREEYRAWQQQFAGWRDQLQQQQHQQWQHYSAWCEAYTQQQQQQQRVAGAGVAPTSLAPQQPGATRGV